MQISMARRKKKKYRINTPSITQSDRTLQGKFDLAYHNKLVEEGGAPGVNSLDPYNNFSTSVDTRCRRGRLTTDDLIRISHSLLIEAAIEKISNIVAQMSWTIKPPPEQVSSPVALDNCRKIRKCLFAPNYTENGSYNKFIKAVIRNLLVFNIAPIQRQEGNEERPFWLWAESPQHFVRNPLFKPETSGITPKFYFCPHGTKDRTKWVPLMEQNLFLIKSRVSTYEVNPKSAVEIAYEHINDWLGLSGYQRRNTDKAIKDYLISLDEQIPFGEAERIRTWWRNDVEGSGEVPIFEGKISVHKFGAKTDAELFLNFKDHVAGLVALAFGLHQKDFNVEQKSGDNRATATVTADQSFQNAMLPIADTIADALNSEVIDYYAEGYSYKTSDREPRGEKEEIESAEKLFQAGMITRNEARVRVGLDPIEGGDTFVDGRVLEK